MIKPQRFQQLCQRPMRGFIAKNRMEVEWRRVGSSGRTIVSAPIVVLEGSSSVGQYGKLHFADASHDTHDNQAIRLSRLS